MNKSNQSSELLSAWEETYKKGQLTLWIFLSLNGDAGQIDHPMPI